MRRLGGWRQQRWRVEEVERSFLANLSGAIILFYTVQSENLEYWGRERRKEREMIHNIEGGEGEGEEVRV